MSDITPYVYSFKDKQTLLSAFMPFVANGGFFLKDTALAMGQKVGLLVELPMERTYYGVEAKVVWVSSAPGKKGVGVQLRPSKSSGELVKAVQHQIMGMEHAQLPTMTL